MDCFAPLAMTVGLFDNRILLRRPGEGRDPYAVFCRSKDSVRRLPVTTNTSGYGSRRSPGRRWRDAWRSIMLGTYSKKPGTGAGRFHTKMSVLLELVAQRHARNTRGVSKVVVAIAGAAAKNTIRSDQVLLLAQEIQIQIFSTQHQALRHHAFNAETGREAHAPFVIDGLKPQW